MDLRSHGLKNTKTRENIIKILENSSDPLTAEDIYKLNTNDDANLSTIYRTLTTFCDKLLLSKEIRQDGTAVYMIKKPTHQHILICSKCHKKIYLNKCPFEIVKNEIYNETGFKIDTHSIELYGKCKDCI